jgi:hypothetical protein
MENGKSCKTECAAKQNCLGVRKLPLFSSSQVTGEEQVFPICPVLEEIVKDDKWKVYDIAKSGSKVLDSIRDIMGIFDELRQFQPTFEVLVWCAHKKIFLDQLINPITEDINLLTLRLESDFPNSSENLENLVGTLKEAFQAYNIYFIANNPLLYLLPPESFFEGKSFNYERFLSWCSSQKIYAEANNPGSGADDIEALTCTYPAEIIKLGAEIYKELVPIERVLSETERQIKGQSPKPTDGDNAGDKVLKPIYEKAYQSYCMAIDKNPDLTDKQDKDIYDWLNREHDEVLPDYELPAFETWQRYLREGRKHYGTSKNTPRAGRTGRSIITSQ